MDIYEAIRARRNVHRFKAEKIPQDKLNKILEAGLQASSALNQQPWEFIVIDDRDLIGKVAQYKYDHTLQGFLASGTPRQEAENIVSTQKDAFKNALPVAVIYNKEKPLPLEAAWNCITTIWLAAIAEGLAASPAYFAPHGQGYLKEILGIPEGYDIAVILRMGIPEVIPDAKPRKSLKECLHYNRFGARQKA
jgi:nitroreductase